MFTSVNGPLASITTSSGTIIVGFSKSFGIGTDGNTGDSVICSGLDSRVVSCSGFSSSIIGECFTIGVENFWTRLPRVSVTKR